MAASQTEHPLPLLGATLAVVVGFALAAAAKVVMRRVDLLFVGL